MTKCDAEGFTHKDSRVEAIVENLLVLFDYCSHRHK